MKFEFTPVVVDDVLTTWVTAKPGPIDNIALPSVTNANEFVSQLQTLAIQASSSRG